MLAILIAWPRCVGSKIHVIDKAKELSLVMNVCRDMASIISCLNLNPDDAFLL